MWRPVLYMLPLALSTLAIRVPVDGKDENVTESIAADKKQDTYYVTDGAVIDSYLIPPDPHTPAEVLPDINTPATYLLPPSAEKQINFYVPAEAEQQTDWYPIAPVPVEGTPLVLLPPRQTDVIFLPNNQTFQALKNPRSGKTFANHVAIPLPSIQLEPPYENSPNEFGYSNPSGQQELPSPDINQEFNVRVPDQQSPVLKTVPKRKHAKKGTVRVKPGTLEPTLATHLTPPKPVSEKYKKPTKLYPKKVSKGFQPIPIPISEFAEESISQVPRAKPAKPFKPTSSAETEYFTPPDEKEIYLIQQAEQKRKYRGENQAKLAQPAGWGTQGTYGVNVPAEQETSETNYRDPGRNAYPAPLRQAPPPAPAAASLKNAPPPPAPDERTEFRMHGMKGPHSYQFGYDTGKGKNRQFRYEERDDDGRVKGHYGYMDRNGKLRVVNYNADPETGFHAESPTEAP